MSERHPTAGPVGTGSPPDPGTSLASECYAWFPALTAALAWQSRVPPVASTHPNGSAPPFAPADILLGDGTLAELAALRAAVACPDLYLIEAAGPDQLRLAGHLALACRQRGERVLVLTAEPIDADKLVVRLRDAGEASVLRALGAGEPANQLPAASAERVGRAHGELAVQQVRARVQVAAHEAAARCGPLEAAATDWESATAARDRCAELHAARTGLSTPTLPLRLAAIAAELEGVRLAHAQATAERDGLRNASEAKKPAGWMASVKRLFAADEVAPGNRPAISTRLADLDAQADALRLEADALHAVAATTRAEAVAELDAHLLAAAPAHDAAQARFNAAGFAVWPTAAELAARLAEVRAEADGHAATLRQFDADAPLLARRLIDAAAVVVGPASALRGEPALHAPGHFDVAIVTDAELLGEAELHSTWSLSGRRVLLGDAAVPPHPPGYRNGRTPPTSQFVRLLHRHHAPGLHVDRGQMTAQLLAVPADAALHYEPLADQPEVELRFLHATGTPVLAQVAFPPNFAVAAAKAFLARELGAYFLRLAGSPDWTETDAAVEARVPGSPAGDGIDLGTGVTEETADGWTVAVRFDKSHGWTLAAAQARLAELAPTPRSARLPRPPKAPEYAQPRRPAGVRG